MSVGVQAERRFLRLKEVCSMVGLSKTVIYGLIRDGEFPAPFKFGRASMWVNHDIYRWQDKVLGNDELI